MYFVENQGADLLNEAITLRVMEKSGVDAIPLQYLLEASKHRQIIMVKAENGEPLASIAFAKISKYTLRLFAVNPAHKLQSYEYSEGKILYILDGFFRNKNFPNSLALLLPQLKKYRLIAHLKNGRLKVFYNKNGRISKVSI